jgi:hypothetical protein
MKKHISIKFAACVAVSILAAGALVWRSSAAGTKADEDAIKEVMKTCHKAPKGVDPICKKAQEGTATPEEIKKLVAGYKTLTTVKPSKGDDASWKEKTSKLYAAAQALEKGGPDAAAKYKAVLDCKGCHTVHRPEPEKK